MIRAIIFDCFGVLTEDSWRAFCRTLPKGEVLDKARQLNQRYDAGLLSIADFVKQLHQVTGKTLKLVEDGISNPNPYKNTELIDYIRQLKKKYKIGLISNVGTNWIRDYFLTDEEQQLFDDMVLSFEAGITKPEAAIYKQAAANLGVEPSECVFIDDIPRYVEAAKARGMAGIVYEDFASFKAELEKLLADADN